VDSFYDADLAKLVSYVTFDGHLAKTVRRFYLSSSEKEPLEDFEKLVRLKFGLETKREKGTGFGESTKSYVYNAVAARKLREAGAPAGDKMLTPFRVPTWIKENPEYSRAYLAWHFNAKVG